MSGEISRRNNDPLVWMLFKRVVCAVVMTALETALHAILIEILNCCEGLLGVSQIKRFGMGFAFIRSCGQTSGFWGTMDNLWCFVAKHYPFLTHFGLTHYGVPTIV